MLRPTVAVVLAAAAWSCGAPTTPPAAPTTGAEPTEPATPTGPAAVAPARAPITLSVVGTNDLHGALPRLPILAGYLNNLRAARHADGGAVLLLDGGDLFQGTLESNVAEGADVVTAYNALGYTAAAVGNHEFDFGPVGPAVVATKPDEDRWGALKARAAEAKFPLLTANIVDAATDAPVTWPNVRTSTLAVLAGVTVGVVGLSTESTPYTTMPANFVGLKMKAPTEAAIAEAKRLREQGATVVAIAAHLGGKCKDFSNPDDHSSCDATEEVMALASALPPGLVDVIVAGHTHQAMAHKINGIPVIESYASGRAFGRVDLQVDASGKVVGTRVHPPQDLCPPGPQNAPVPTERCAPGSYESQPVVRDPGLEQIVAAAWERTRARREEKLTVTATAPITREHERESALGNWFTDLMLAANPRAQVAMTNGGGLRSNIPAGDITYGQLFEAMPFDNRFVLIALTGAQLRELVTSAVTRGGAHTSWGGLTATATCKGAALAIDIRVAGKPLADRKTYTMVTSDFLATGGDGALAKLALAPQAVTSTNVIMRDGFADMLRAQKIKRVDPTKLYDPAAPRLRLPGKRPLSCAAPAAPLGAPPAPPAAKPAH